MNFKTEVTDSRSMVAGKVAVGLVLWRRTDHASRSQRIHLAKVAIRAVAQERVMSTPVHGVQHFIFSMH